MRIVASLTLAAALVTATLAQAPQSLTNDDVLQLLTKRVTADEIVRIVTVAPGTFEIVRSPCV